MQDEQARVDDAFAYQRNVVEHIYCLLYTCRGVDIASELRPDALEVLEDAFPREVLRPVEAHVLEEVGETVLVRSLLDGSDICGQIEFGSVFRFVVVSDVVGEPVLELPLPYSRVIGQLVLPEDRHGSENGHEENKNPFHILYIKKYFPPKNGSLKKTDNFNEKC